jgi:hypothetical protein
MAFMGEEYSSQWGLISSGQRAQLVEHLKREFKRVRVQILIWSIVFSPFLIIFNGAVTRISEQKTKASQHLIM